MAVPIKELIDNPEALRQFMQRYTAPTPIYPANETITEINILLKLLTVQADPDPDLIKSLVAFDATYVSVTEDNPDLHQIMPWAGTHDRVGPQAFINTFTQVGLYWTRGPFQIDALFTDGQGNVTAWGNFELTSNTMKRTVRSPWSVRATVNGDGLVSYFIYMEDTFATASTFWADGSREYCANPYGGCVWV